MKLLHNHKWSEPCNALSCPVSYALSKGKKVAGEWAPDSAVDVRRELEAELDAWLEAARELIGWVEGYEADTAAYTDSAPDWELDEARTLRAVIAKAEGRE